MTAPDEGGEQPAASVVAAATEPAAGGVAAGDEGARAADTPASEGLASVPCSSLDGSSLGGSSLGGSSLDGSSLGGSSPGASPADGGPAATLERPAETGPGQEEESGDGVAAGGSDEGPARTEHDAPGEAVRADEGLARAGRGEPGDAITPPTGRADERPAQPHGEPGDAVAPEATGAPEVVQGRERAEHVVPVSTNERPATTGHGHHGRPEAPARADGRLAQAGRGQERTDARGARPRGIERHYRVRPSLRARAQRLLVASPGYAIAGFLHLLAIVVLSFFTVAAALDERRPPVEVRLVAATEEVVTAPERPISRLDVAPPDLDAALRPEVHAGDAFHEALGPDVGHLAGAAEAFGVGASGGAGRGGTKDARGGASAASDGALHLGLDWLVRHRAESGAWGELPHRHDTTGALPRDGEVAQTGLAVMCFLFAGHGPEREGPYREVVRTAIAWLVARVGRDGVFGRDYQGYHQAIGTLALAEALARERTPELQGAVRRAVGCLEDAQHLEGGWRYRPADRGDTSVTAWAALALKSASHTGLTINRRTWDLLRQFVDAVSRPDGTTAYMTRGYGTVAMGASGLFLRLMLGEAPTTPRNQAAARLLSVHGETLPHGPLDHYCAYYVALAMYQVGGEPWRKLNPTLRDTLVARQRTGGCERGAWTEWQTPLLSTTFAILTLETYYRYLTTHEGPGDDDAEESPGRRALAEATQLLEQATRHGDRGLSLAAEAAFEAALAALAAEPDGADLAAEARARLVQCAALLGDGERALARAEDYLAALPRGAPPQPAVLRVRRGELVRRALDAARAAATGDAAAAARVDEALRAAEAALVAERAVLDPTARAEADRAAEALAGVRVRLGFARAPDRALDDAVKALPPPDGPAGLEEQLALEAAVDRAVRAFAGVARGELAPDALARADADLAWVASRRAPERAPPEVARRLAADLERAALARALALLAAGRDEEAAADARAFAARHPASPARAEAEAVERAALARRVEQRAASPDERARLVELLAAWARGAPEGEADTPWLGVGELLLALGALDDADRSFARAVAVARDPEQVVAARLRRAALALTRGALDDADGHLAGLDATRADVRLERCALLRARGRPREALDGYHALLRGLEATRPPAWWEAAIGAAEAYAELGEPGQGRALLDGLRRKDPTFGGDEARRRRIIDLMVRLDAAR